MDQQASPEPRFDAFLETSARYLGLPPQVTGNGAAKYRPVSGGPVALKPRGSRGIDLPVTAAAYALSR